MALSVMNPLDWSRASQIFILLSFLKDVFAPLSSRLHCFSHIHKIYGVPHCCFFVDMVSFFSSDSLTDFLFVTGAERHDFHVPRGHFPHVSYASGSLSLQSVDLQFPTNLEHF